MQYMQQHTLLPQLFTSAGERKCKLEGRRTDDLFASLWALSADPSPASEITAIRAAVGLEALKCRMAAAVEEREGSSLQESGCIFSWLSVLPQSEDLNGYVYTVPHCDKANNFEYDVTALLYLNSLEECTPSSPGLPSFTGGSLAFLEEDGDAILEPQVGRLVVFDSDERFLHRVEPVTSGDRFLLSVWFQRSRAGGE